MITLSQLSRCPLGKLSEIAALLILGPTTLGLTACTQTTLNQPANSNASSTVSVPSDSAEFDPTAAATATANNGPAKFDATATVTYTWQTRYSRAGGSLDRPNDSRIEKFASVSLVNHNGVRPGKAVTGPDEDGLWWPALPPKPTVDDLEDRAQRGERAERPELIKSVDYAISFDKAGEAVTLPTNYHVYRQAVKAHANQLPLSLTFGPNDRSVINAKIQ